MRIDEFLLARIDEIDPLHGRLSDNLPHHPYCGGMTADVFDDEWQYEFRPELCDCGWPQRVLADCAAKRAIVELHRLDPYASIECADCDGVWPCGTLRLLAKPFIGHDDFDPSWAPDTPTST